MKTTFTITGPGVHETRRSAEIALSFAITPASHAAKNGIEATYYVNDPDGNVVGSVESFVDGSCSIFGVEHYERQAA